MKVLKGFCYCVTAATDTTVTDDNGLSLAVKAGEQGYFVASTDEVSESGTCTIVQVRGNFNMPTTEGGGGPVINGMYVEEGELKGNGFNIFTDVITVTKNLDMSKISDGSYMFYSGLDNPFSNITSFTADLTNLTNGRYMFFDCVKLTSWNVELPNLTNGDHMFYGCNRFTSWTVDLPSLTDGAQMFGYCGGMTSFAGDLSELAGTSSINGGYKMFTGCPKLTSFNSALPKLVHGADMFRDCILDEASVLRILNSIPTHTSETHKLHLGKRTNYMNSTDIADLLGTTTPIAAATNYSYKGWTITVLA